MGGAITGTAADGNGSGVETVQVSIRRGTGNYWDGTGFNSVSEQFVAATGTTQWTLALTAASLSAGGPYTVHSRASDYSGNTESGPTATFTFIATTVVLVDSVVVNGDQGGGAATVRS